MKLKFKQRCNQSDVMGQKEIEKKRVLKSEG